MTVRKGVWMLCTAMLMGVASAALAQSPTPVPTPDGIVPEPSAYAMLACGATAVGGMLLARSRRNRK
jgi:hypothetical protein